MHTDAVISRHLRCDGDAYSDIKWLRRLANSIAVRHTVRMRQKQAAHGPHCITSAERLPGSSAGISTRRIGPFVGGLVVTKSSCISPGAAFLQQ
jgi:hypothetical protein